MNVPDDALSSPDDVTDALSAFVDHHRDCGDLSTDVVNPPGGEAYVWMACDGCGARLERKF